MDSTILYEADKDDIKPVLVNGRPVYEYYERIQIAFSDHIGGHISEFMAYPPVPDESETKMVWVSDQLQKPEAYTDLSGIDRERLRPIVSHTISKIRDLLKSLEASGTPDSRELAEIIAGAMIVPSFDALMVEGDSFVVAGWGFTAVSLEQGKIDLLDAFQETFVNVGTEANVRVRIRVLDKENNPACNMGVTASFGGASAAGITDRDGRAGFPKVPVASVVHISVDVPESEPFETDVACYDEDSEHVIQLPIKCEQKAAMHFQVTTKSGKQLKGVPLELTYKDKKLDDLTDEEGISVFPDIPIGERVMLAVKIPGEKTITKMYRCDRGEDVRKVIIAIPKKSHKPFIIFFSALILIALILIVRILMQGAPGLPEVAGFVDFDDKWVVDADDPLKRSVLEGRITIMLDETADLHKFAEELGMRYPNEDLRLIGYRPEYNLIQAEVSEEKRLHWKAELGKWPNVAGVFNDSRLKTNHVPRDPGFQDKTDEKAWAFSAIRGFEAWEISLGDRRTIIAVTDTGFDTRHEELKGKIAYPKNVLTGKARLKKNDQSGHGNHLAATSAGNADNDYGVCGVCPECRIMPIQVADKKGNVTETSLISGLFHAGRYGARVVVLPFSTDFGDAFLNSYKSLPDKERTALRKSVVESTAKNAEMWNRVFEHLIRKGAIIIQAAGNEGIDALVDPMKRSEFPIIVGAVAKTGKPAPFSNYGPEVDISAPGDSIYNAASDNQYDFLTGTSVAAAMTAGAAGLVKSARPDLSHEIVKSILIEQAVKLPQTGDGDFKNVGPLLQANSALEKALTFGKDNCRCQDEIEQLRDEIELLKERLDLGGEQVGPEPSTGPEPLDAE